MDEELHRDIMAEVLSAFKKHWDSGNKWMLHIVTKSPHILRHLPILSSMREMIQVEMTLSVWTKTEEEVLSQIRLLLMIG